MKRTLAIVLFLSAAAVPLSATLVERLTLEQLTDRSERIIHGRCRRVWSAWDAQHQAIWTHCEVEVLDRLRGTAGTVIASEPGGVVEGVEMSIEGVAGPRAGEEVVLFLYQVPNGMWRTRGLGQGKLRVIEDRVYPSLEGLSLVEPLQPGVERATDLRSVRGMPLVRLKAAIRGRNR
jgi:hypothetical protein